MKETDDPDIEDLPPEQRQRLMEIMMKMMEMGIGAVYGQEEEGVPEADIECGSKLAHCRAKCCAFIFALTKEEVAKGRIKHNPARPYFIARDSDGYCPHLERNALRCMIWEERPLRCRRYDCRVDSDQKV